jgi:hypothetical protein
MHSMQEIIKGANTRCHQSACPLPNQAIDYQESYRIVSVLQEYKNLFTILRGKIRTIQPFLQWRKIFA